MSQDKTECCYSGGDVVTKTLGKIGVCRSALFTLALVPFAWDGVVWFAEAIRSLFDLVSGGGNCYPPQRRLL